MDHTQTTPEVISVKSYVFPIELAEEDDGRWSAWIATLPGCAAWGYTKEEALKAIQDAAEAYVEDMIEAGEQLPTEGVVVVDAPVVTVTHGA
jgi:predicted RNase H-like HicB family nuclease